MQRIKQNMVCILILIFACLLLLSGCSKKELVNNSITGEILDSEKSEALIDGTYTAISKYYDPRGYGQRITASVHKGIITKVTYEETNAQGTNRLSVPSPKEGWTETDLGLDALRRVDRSAARGFACRQRFAEGTEAISRDYVRGPLCPCEGLYQLEAGEQGVGRLEGDQQGYPYDTRGGG